MSTYPRSASQFLASTFVSFGQGGQAEQAPLFYSTVDGGSARGDEDEYDDNVGSSNFYRQQGIASTASGRGSQHASVHRRHDAYRHHQPSQAGGASYHDEEQEDMEASASYSPDDAYNHDGLGRTPSETGSDGSVNPFRSHGTRSRQSAASSAAPSSRQQEQHSVSQQAESSRAGWRMHATNLLPGVKQAVLHNLYEQSESVYSSVWIGNKQDKGKQKAVNDIEEVSDGESSISRHPASPPDFVAEARTKSLPLHHSQSGRRTHDSNLSVHEQYTSTRRPPRIHRYPMPTARYRREAMGVKGDGATSTDVEYQDQSYRDPLWLAAYLFNSLFSVCISIYLLLFDSTPKPSSSHLIAPSMAILRSIPLLSLLVFASLLVVTSTLAYTLLIKNGARQAAFAFVLAPPVVFLIGAGWAFEASFSLEYSSPNDPRAASSWAQTTLRVTSIFLLASAGLAFRRSWKTLFSTGSSSHRARLERTIRVLQVSAEVVMQHPQLILLAIALVGAYIISSVPAVLVIAQLLYHGTVKQGTSAIPSESYTYLIPSTWSIVFSLHTAFVYFWTLGLLRAVYQHTITGTVGTWWYQEESRKAKQTTEQNLEGESIPIEAKSRKLSLVQAQQNITDALHRAVGPSLGTLCASSLILAILSLFTLLISLCYSLVNRSRRWTGSNVAANVSRMIVNFVVLPLIAILTSMVRNLNAFTLIHSAITGDGFWDASGEATELIMGRNGTDMVASRRFHLVC